MAVDVRKYLPGHLREPSVNGRVLGSLAKAVNETLEKTDTLIQACVDQLFITSASGRFLIQLGEEQGFTMPANSGLDIRAYRTLVPSMVSDPKQIRTTINDLIQSFYNSERTKPSVTSTVLGPYSISAGDDLIVETENGIATVSIVTGQVSDFSNVSASEIASVLNSSQSSYSAEAIKDRATGQDFLRVTSVTQGVGAFVRIAGGKLQNILKFDNLIDTLNATGTNWILSKETAYTDKIIFTWDGVGTNPNIYLAKKDDTVTIRGFVDGVYPSSLLNGSYSLVDVGYDYFIIKNEKYDSLTSSVTQNLDNNIIFTKNEKIILYNKDEYATTSETELNAITVTVPAVPPLAKRFLSGSFHLHGNYNEIIDFTRNSIKIDVHTGSDKPVADNQFFIKNKYKNIDARAKKYKTNSVDSNPTNPTYIVESNDNSFSFLPYTVATLINTNPLFMEMDTNTVKVTFPFKHGMLRRWGITFSGATGEDNILASYINTEHEVSNVINEFALEIKLKDGSGDPINFNGVLWGPADIYQHPTIQADGSDFYLQFASPSQAIASGLTPGLKFHLDPLSGTDNNLYLSGLLKNRYLAVSSRVGSKINFSSGIGIGLGGLTTTAVSGRRSSHFGDQVYYRLNKTSLLNEDRVFSDLNLVMIAYTPPANPEYLGSYVFDPNGSEYNLTVSKFVVKLTDNILKGGNIPFLQIDTTIINGESYPQSGEIVIDYGTDGQEGPIRYFAVITNPGSNQILIDPAYKFKKSHDVGSKVQYIRQSNAYTPKQDGSDYQPYITGTTAARNTLFSLIDLLVAAGIFVQKDVILPKLRYVDEAINPFE